jgi:AraC family transcriptional regulator
MMDTTYSRCVEPRAQDWRSFAWGTGSFDSGRRTFTKTVEGIICTPEHLVMVTLQGGSERLEVRADGGHNYAGSDRAGAVSFVPAYCERRMSMTGVRSGWASISLRPKQSNDGADDGSGCEDPLLLAAPFTNIADPFISSLVGEIARLHSTDGALDAGYCEVMSLALRHYLVHRHAKCGTKAASSRSPELPRWRIRRISDYVDAHLGEPILIGELASLVGLSTGHLHRAFRATMGITPLDYVSEKRVRSAAAMLANERVPITDLALRVGFLSPSHFARTFRRVIGVNPSRYSSVE